MPKISSVYALSCLLLSATFSYDYSLNCLIVENTLYNFRCVQNVKEWRTQTCPCTASVLETLTSLSQPRFLLSNSLFTLVMKTFCIVLNSFSPFLHFKSFSEQIMVFRNIASHYNMSFLEETIDWLLVMSPQISQNTRQMWSSLLPFLSCICGNYYSL